MPSQITTRKYRIKDKHVNVAECGEGEPLVLIHGWSNNWQGWTLLAEELAGSYRLYMIDLPGFGDSDPLEHYTLDVVTEYVSAFIEQIVPNAKAIIGASLGTLVTANLISKREELAKSMILLGAVFQSMSIAPIAVSTYTKFLKTAGLSTFGQKGIETMVKSPLMAYAVDMFLNSYTFNKHLVDTYNLPGRQKITGKSYIQLGLSAKSLDLEALLTKTRIPTLLIYGDSDKYVRPTNAVEIVTRCNNAQLSLEIIEKCGHNPGVEQPRKTAEAIRNFLKSESSLRGA